MKKILAFLFAVSLFYFVGAQSVLASSLFNVEVRTYLDGSNMNQAASGLVDQARGSKVQFNASGISPEYTFAFYAVNDIVRDDLPQNYEFVVRSNMKITAFFRPNGSVTPANARHVVIFADNNGKIIADGIQYVADGGTATEPSVLPTKPNATYATPKWFTPQGESSLENITSSRVYLLQYVSSDNTEYTVNVTGGSVVEDAPFNYNDVVTLVPNAAPAEQVFSHWEDAEGNVLSTKANYKFTVMGNVSVQAVFAASPESLGAVVNMSDALSIRSGYVTYKGQFDLPAGFTLVEYGFIFSRSSDVLTLDSLGATIVPSNVHNGQTGEFLRSFPNDTFNSVRAYLIVKNAAQEEVIVYSNNYEKLLFTTSNYTTGFESVSPAKGSYAAGETTSDGIVWNLSDSLVGNAADDRKIGAYSVRIRAGFAETKTLLNNIISVAFQTAKYGGDANSTIFVYVSSDGTNWVDITDAINASGITVSSTTLTQVNINLQDSSNFNNSGLDAQSGLYVRISKSGTTRVNIDSINITFKSYPKLHEVIYNNATPSSENVLDGQPISNTVPTQTGYSFVGWYADIALTQSYNVSAPVVQSLQLYAKWTINEYTITFNSAGGSAVSPITQDYNTSVVAPANPTREGYSFTGWSQAVPSNMPAENLTLTAQWSINQYTISFDSNEGSAVSAITQDFGTNVSAPLNPTREGYLFQGWFTDDNTFLNEYVFGTMPSQNITVYAKWEEQVGTYYTVTFNSNGGSAVSSQQVLSGDYADEPAVPTRNGYTFVNWQDETNVVWDFANDPIIEAMTLYATWSPVTYSLTFENLQGTTQSNPGTYNIETSTITLTNPSAREGYNFSGWFTALVGGSQITQIVIGSTGNVIVYARWAEILPTVLRQSDFGETNSNNSTYANFYIDTLENGANDPLPNGNSSYSRAGGNYNGTSWDYMALGRGSTAAIKGDLITSNTTSNAVVDSTDPNHYVATRFSLNGVNTITLRVYLLAANTTIYLQTSTDGINWVDNANHVQSTAISADSNISFSGLSLSGDIYYRFVFVNATPGSNGWLARIKTITYYQNPS